MIKKIFIIIVKSILFLLLVIGSGLIDDFLGTLIASFIIFYYTLIVFVWMRKKFNENEIKNRLYNVKNRKIHYSMFTWLGEEIDTDLILFDLIGEEFEKTDSIDTLKRVIKLIKSKVGNDITDYYILRDFVHAGLKNNFSEYLKGSISKFTVSAAFLAILPLIFKNISIANIKFEINEYTMINIVFLILYFFISITFISIFYNMFIKPKRRAKLLLNVLNIIINDMESKKNEN
ncbi:hypothetical protein ACQKEY_07215 [Lysinibacillus fusiformis]|uniref:hypothetical protein n=1 Tax=Lysinibacillus fusiformis TaxID=28031 RepID=UPI003CFD91BC